MSTGTQPFFKDARKAFHSELLSSILTVNSAGVYSNADKDSAASRAISERMAQLMNASNVGERLAGQTSGVKFESAVATFIRTTFGQLSHLRPGRWRVEQVTGKRLDALARFAQFAHLTELAKAASQNIQLAAALGNDYAIKPDVVVYREPEQDEDINNPRSLVDSEVSNRAVLRRSVSERPLLHASISCKWTMRSDRSQNSRTEALNLIRNRKGGLPHIVTVMAEPMPSRISSVALGTGDIDCTYHFALYELQQAVSEVGSEDAQETLHIMVEGGRLKDISDLPLDLAV